MQVNLKERNMIMDKISIKSQLFDYSVEFVDSFAAKLAEIDGECAYVIDRNVYELYGGDLACIDPKRLYLMEAVEDRKNIDTILDIIAFWKGLGLRKNWKVICIGGGITQDVTTFASDIYLRNVDWYFFPTTLLSMCDSCIGGKCGINLGEYKNQLGVFYPPKKIFIDIRFLDTLSYADHINGWGELLKFSLTLTPDFYKRMESLSTYIPCPDIGAYIHEGLLVKKEIIEADEFEGGLRRVLNYGHTFGHALESYTDHAIAHGKAVIWGIDIANYLSAKRGLISPEDYERVKALIKRAFIPEEIMIEDADKLFAIIRTDKKVKNNTIFMALPDALGHLGVYPIEIDGAFSDAFKAYLRETHEYYSH